MDIGDKLIWLIDPSIEYTIININDSDVIFVEYDEQTYSYHLSEIENLIKIRTVMYKPAPIELIPYFNRYQAIKEEGI